MYPEKTSGNLKAGSGMLPADPGVLPAVPLGCWRMSSAELQGWEQALPELGAACPAAGLNAGIQGRLPHPPPLRPAGVSLRVTQMLCSQSTTGTMCLHMPCWYTLTDQSGVFIY